MNKIKTTKENDVSNIAELVSRGWKAIEVWECELKTIEKRQQRFKELLIEIVE